MVVWLHDEQGFPDSGVANEDGLLAIGGDLSVARLLEAYRKGIFPWFSDDDPPMWWSPDPRFVLFPGELKVSRSMQKVLSSGIFHITFDRDFGAVIKNCRDVRRKGQKGTWITADMMEAYIALHEKGIAHSVEVWRESLLVGGLYGVSLGRMFFGESMFSLQSNASKAGFITLVRWLSSRGFEMIDCQVYTRHLASLGARSIPRPAFQKKLTQALRAPDAKESWIKENL